MSTLRDSYERITTPYPDTFEEEVNRLIALADFKRQEQLTVFGNSISESLNNFGLWFARSSEGGVVFLYNAGVGGNTTPMMLTRLSDIPLNTTLCTVMEATNDAASGVTPVQHGQNMKEIFKYLLDNGIKPLWLVAPPHDDPARSQLVDQMNMYDYITAQELGIGAIDIWSQFANPATGSWVAGASDDGTHPNSPTELTAGNTLQVKWANNQYYIPLPRNNANSGINPNACFLTASATNQPANWATNNNQTSKLLSETPFALGNTWTTNWVNSAVFFNSSRFSVTAGDRYLFVIRFGLTVNSGSTPVSFYLEYDTPVGDPAIDRVYFMRNAEVSVDDTTMSLDFTVPAGVSTVRFACNGSSGTFDLDIKVGQAQMYNLSDFTL